MDCSIIIVSKGRATFTETLESILKQTRKPKEVLINFDSDRDVYVRLNELAAQTTTDAFFPLCDDDLIAPTFIEETLGRMEETEANCVYTNLLGFGSESGEHIPDKHPFFTTLFRKTAWATVGGYEPDAGLYADALFGMKIWRLGKKEQILKPLFLYRGHPGQLTKELGGEVESEKLKAKICLLK